MLAVYLILIAVVVGMIASRGNRRLATLYVPVAFVGALTGALVAFGDAPFLMQYPILNSFTLALLSSVVVVSGVWLWRRRRTMDH